LEKETRFRNKITWFSTVFSVLVVWVHSVNGELFLGRTEAAEKVMAFEKILGSTIGQIAVPGFFMMSGYLFFRGFRWNRLGEKWNSRIRSVLVPFLLWNGIYYLGYVIGSRLPVVADIVAKGTVPFGWYTAVEAVLHYSYNYVFWYLYQLLLLILLAPVLYWILRRPAAGAAVLTVCFWGTLKGMTIPCLNLDALFYYSLAAFGGLHGRGLVERAWTMKRCVAGGGLVAAAAAILIARWPGGIGEGVVLRTLGPVGLWFMTDEFCLPVPKEWMKYNFYLYAIHFALVRLINKTAARYCPGYWPLPVILYLLMPAFMIAISTVTGKWLKNHMPRTWFLLNGGR